MTVTRLHDNRRNSDPHWDERVDLACAFRWTARLNMHEGLANHFSMAVSDDGSKFLMNPSRRHFSRIRASDLLLLDAHDGETMKGPNPPDLTAWDIHGALHRQVPQARCIMHVHSKYALVLATLKDPVMPPIDQNSMRFFERIAYDNGYDGMGLGEEAERLAATLGGKTILVMGNHGVLFANTTVAAAFDDMYYFERACETLVTAYMTGRELNVASDAVARKTADQWLAHSKSAGAHLGELKAILDREDPDYKT